MDHYTQNGRKRWSMRRAKPRWKGICWTFEDTYDEWPLSSTACALRELERIGLSEDT